MDSIPKMDADASVPLYSIPGAPPDLSGEFVGCRFEPRCRNAIEQCRVEEPPLVEDGGHLVACFNPVGSADAPRHAIRVVDAAEAARLALQRVQELASRKVIVEVDQLVKEFPVTAGAVLQRKVGSVKAVSNVSFAVREGETFGLVGESGCGKTTIGRLVVALEKPTAGTIRFDGTDVTHLGRGDLRRSRRDFQIMFQDPYASLDPRMRVGTILREPLKVQNIGSRDRTVGARRRTAPRGRPRRRRRSTSIRTNSPGASANASALPALSRSIPASSSPTSPSRPSTSPSSRRSST